MLCSQTAPVYADNTVPAVQSAKSSDPVEAYSVLSESIGYISGSYPEEYAGSWLSDGKLVTALTDMSEKTLNKYKEILKDFDCVSFVKANYSYNYLQKKADEIAGRLNDSHIAGYGVDVMKNVISFDYNGDTKAFAEKILALFPELEGAFAVEYVGGMPVLDSAPAKNTLKSVKGVVYLYSADGEKLGKYTGWTSSAAGKRYFKNGVMLTKASVINGKLYLFDKDGICGGKYSGKTSSKKGFQYWENGALKKACWIVTKSGSKYYAGEDGYLLTGWQYEVPTHGRGVYSFFDESGVWDGYVYYERDGEPHSYYTVNVEEVSVSSDYQWYDSLDELYRSSDLIIKCEVRDSEERIIDISSGSGDECLQPYIVSDVKILDVIKGDKGQADTEVKQFGGLMDGYRYTEDDTEYLIPGEKYLLFLKTYEKNPASLLNPVQAMYRIGGTEYIAAEKNDIHITEADLSGLSSRA